MKTLPQETTEGHKAIRRKWARLALEAGFWLAFAVSWWPHRADTDPAVAALWGFLAATSLAAGLWAIEAKRNTLFLLRVRRKLASVRERLP